jgi:SAM-dependent methyltransferase
VPRVCHLDAEAQRARYAKHRNSADDAGYVAMLRRPVALLRQYHPAARRVLDYGCGREQILVGLLRREGYEAVGYDPLYGSDADMSSPFDAVVAVESMEHFPEPGGELQRIRGLLAPGGCLVVMTALHRGPDTIKDWWYARDPTHVSFYSAATMTYIAEAFGFRILFTDNKRNLVLQAGEG